MDLVTLSDEIQRHYEAMALRFSEAQRTSGLACPPGCGQCCSVPTVEASVFEMLPMALALYHQGRAPQVLEHILETRPSSCVMYRPSSSDKSQGQCSMYRERPSVCRMFAVAALPGKHPGERSLSICHVLKAQHPHWPKIDPHTLPLINEAYAQLSHLHPELTKDRGPISVTLGKALEKVLFYQALKNA